MQVEKQSNDADVGFAASPTQPGATPFTSYYGRGAVLSPYPVYGYPYPNSYTGYSAAGRRRSSRAASVRLLHDVNEDAIDTKTTETQLASRYAKTTYPPDRRLRIAAPRRQRGVLGP